MSGYSIEDMGLAQWTLLYAVILFIIADGNSIQESTEGLSSLHPIPLHSMLLMQDTEMRPSPQRNAGFNAEAEVRVIM